VGGTAPGHENPKPVKRKRGGGELHCRVHQNTKKKSCKSRGGGGGFSEEIISRRKPTGGGCEIKKVWCVHCILQIKGKITTAGELCNVGENKVGNMWGEVGAHGVG